MDKASLVKSNHTHKNLLLILSIISFGLNLIARIIYFRFSKPNGIFDVIQILVSITPYVLTVLYFGVFGAKSKASALVPIIFAYISMTSVLSLVNYIDIYFRHGLSAKTDFIFSSLIVVFYGAAAVSAIKGFPNKVILIIASSIGFSIKIYSLINTLNHFDKYRYIYEWIPYRNIISATGVIILYATLLIFGLTNRETKAPLISCDEKNPEQEASPEEKLKLLKNAFDLDILTEEEYQAKRAEIIDKL